MKPPVTNATASVREFVEGHPVFDGLPEPTIRRLVDGADELRFGAASAVIERGQPGDAMFLLIEGAAEVPIIDDNGRLRFTAHLGPGDVFGEMALLTGAPRTADVITTEPVRCLRFERESVERLMRHEPSVAGLLTSLVGHRLLESDGIREVGKYRLVGELGVGGMGRVYQGVHPQLGRPVAIKMLDHALVHRDDFADRFRAEARIIASMRHPNIVDLYDVEEAWGTMFIVMEQLEGEALDVLLHRGPMDANLVRRIVRDVASALACAHEHGVVHRDVKPGNVLLVEGRRACLTDFGVATTGAVTGASDGRFVGTPAYAAPEHALGLDADPRSDIYSLGILAWALLVGHPPYDGSNTSEVLRRHIHEDVPPLLERDPTVPEDLAEFVERACRRDRERRWQTCDAVLDHFEWAQRRTTAPNNVQIRTLTLVYSPDAEGDVDRLVDAFDRMAAPIDGLRVKSS